MAVQEFKQEHRQRSYILPYKVPNPDTASLRNVALCPWIPMALETWWLTPIRLTDGGEN